MAVGYNMDYTLYIVKLWGTDNNITVLNNEATQVDLNAQLDIETMELYFYRLEPGAQKESEATYAPDGTAKDSGTYREAYSLQLTRVANDDWKTFNADLKSLLQKDNKFFNTVQFYDDYPTTTTNALKFELTGISGKDTKSLTLEMINAEL